MCLFRFVGFCVAFNDLCCWTSWFTVTHTIKINRPKLADWSKWIFITLWSCFCSLLTSNWEVNTGRLHYSFINFTQITQKVNISWYIDDIETKLPIGRQTLRVFTWHFQEIFAKGLFRCFIFVFVWICCVSCHFCWLMLLNATSWNTVTHAFQGNRLNLADWSKRVCITHWSCFCSLMTSNWEVSSGRLHYSFTKFTQIAQTFVISWYIDDIETNLPIGRHIFVYLHDILKDC